MEKKNTISYDVNKSSERIDEILNASNNNFGDKKDVPDRSNLTYKNGYYVDVTAVFIDIVGSSDMTNEHKRPTLAKMYRAFLSECVAIMNAEDTCKEININGDCVWGVFDTPKKADIDNIITIIGKLNAFVSILNYKLKRKSYSQIKVGIGADDGRALMVKAGYSGSGINDVIWMGDVVNSACHLCNSAGRGVYKPILVSSSVYNNMENDKNKKLLSRVMINGKICYQGDFVNTYMNDWYKEHCR